MKVLFIGGTGTISTAVSKIAVDRGIDLYVLNRGKRNDKLPEGVTILQGDIYDLDEVKKVLAGHYFDSIVQWISFTVDHVKRDYELFNNFTKQFVFISSASAYFKPISYLPITEEMPLGNVYWDYSENKKKCEEYLLSVHNPNFNVTIIRPSHTYNDEMLISQLKSRSKPYTMINRMLQKKPIILPDDGGSLWTLTYNKDFASGFVDVLGNKDTYGEYYHLTGEKVYTWERLNEIICEAVGVIPDFIYIPTDYILKYFPDFKGELYGDKKDNAIFDNSKIKKVAPNWISETDYSAIAKLAVHRLLENPELQEIDEEFDRKYDKLIQDYKASL
jgi:nucleoside-diphosphate-sugar epimerase